MSFNFSIISPEGKLFEQQVHGVNLPGSEGRFGVLEGHMNFTSTIKPGVVKVRLSDSHVEKFIVYDGIAQVTAKSCSLLIEKAISEGDINSEDFRQSLDVARENLAKAETEVEKNSLKMEIEYLEAGLSL